jgi:hypothetical protein
MTPQPMSNNTALMLHEPQVSNRGGNQNYSNQIANISQNSMNDSMLMDNTNQFDGFMDNDSFTANNNDDLDESNDPDFIKVRVETYFF